MLGYYYFGQSYPAQGPELEFIPAATVTTLTNVQEGSHAGPGKRNRLPPVVLVFKPEKRWSNDYRSYIKTQRRKKITPNEWQSAWNKEWLKVPHRPPTPQAVAEAVAAEASAPSFQAVPLVATKVAAKAPRTIERPKVDRRKRLRRIAIALLLD